MEPTVDHLLRRASKAERRRVVAWLLAAVPVVAIVALVGSGPIAVALAAVAALLALWSMRQVYGLALARRDFNAAATPPRRRRSPNPMSRSAAACSARWPAVRPSWPRSPR